MSERVIPRPEFSMRQFADRFKVMMLDDASRLAASMIANGGCFWRNGSGGVGVAHNGFCMNLDARQANQIRAILPIRIEQQAARLSQANVARHLLDLLCLPGPGDLAEAQPVHATPRPAFCAIERGS